ncbi:transmembrane 4 L6 family member 5 isoform X1 [Oncorhynchus tshawytscha]|uniref:transmembrane 4 L6 family member 5 isoform X1 n=2 Tax=Oncorhynchus tshawytscha TaxID=74940 RepID=UPI000D098F67|nr:transmembrane 4 L6 family member 5 isoform X1 [Oncorhynchus tshawytscha]XP_024297788.1 transmembrane 4 L6 family member 5 isoform X1 [Oncorhynchus tshawytscha]
MSTTEMCVASCSRCVGVSLVPMAFVCMLANGLLLLPDLQARYLLDGHVTREARWGTGLWASGFLVLIGARGFVIGSSREGCCAYRIEMLCQVGCSCVALAAAVFCCLVSATGLVQGPLCLHNSTQGLAWEMPLKPQKSGDPIYLFDRTLWPAACEEPRNVVQWNVVLFSVLMATSGLQAVLCAAHTINAILGIIFGPRFCKNQVSPA